MRGAKAQVYLHFVWATWRRHPFITLDIQQRLYGELVRSCEEISIGDFAGRVKGASSHLVTHVLRPGEPFKWQGGYGVFSVSKRNLEKARNYVLNQEQHHREGTVHAALERLAD